MKFSALLLDFGGVLYDIDPKRTIKAFAELAAPDSYFNTLSAINYSTLPFLSDYEKGLISSNEFRAIAAEIMGIQPSLAIDDAWNRTLLGVKSNMDLIINELSGSIPLFLLSNTNEIHHNYFAPESATIFNQFEHCYFSYTMKMHKPDLEIFEFVANDLQMNPKEILFVDDMIDNIIAAQSLNFCTFHIDNAQNTIYTLSDYLHTVQSPTHQKI